MPYKTVQWSEGDAIDMAKIEQMAINDDIIQQEILKRPMGVITRGEFIGASVASGSLVLTLPTVSIPSARYLKMTMKCQYKNTSVNTACVFTVEDLLGAVTYMSLNAYDAWDGAATTFIAEATGSRILYAMPGSYQFAIRITNASTQTISYEGNAAILMVEDVGSGYYVYPDQLKALI